MLRMFVRNGVRMPVGANTIVWYLAKRAYFGTVRSYITLVVLGYTRRAGVIQTLHCVTT